MKHRKELEPHPNQLIASCFAQRGEHDLWATKLVRIGVASAVPILVIHMALIGLRFPRFAHSVVPILSADLLLSLTLLAWTWTAPFQRRWHFAVCAWALALVVSACSIGAITQQYTALYVALVMMLFGTAAFAPWGARWEAVFIALAIATTTAVSLLSRGFDSFEPYRLLELATASGISLYIAALTQRYRLEMAARIDSLRLSEQKFWQVFDANPDAISIIRLDDERYINVNLELLRSGYTRDELIGRTEAELKLWVDENQRLEYWRALRQAGRVRQFEARFRLKDGGSVTCQLSGVVVDLSAGRCVISALRNVERLKQAEREIVAAREAAEAASRSKSAFLSNMSHEIRTPMNAILGMAEVIAESPLTLEQRKYLNVMINNGSALLELINDILDFARVESGRMSLEQVTFDLLELVERVAETFAIRAHQKELELLVKVAADCPPRVIGDPLRLRQILINLLGNALKFTERGEIALEVRTEGPNQLHFTVSDTGIGIAREHHEEIFGSFTQAESSTARRFGGTGLGLAIVRQIAGLMGGRIWVESAPGTGSAFHVVVELPAADGASSRPPQQTLVNTTVLLIDDNAAARALLGETLTAHGAELRSGAATEPALDAVRRGVRCDAILIDSLIPGSELLESIERLIYFGVERSRIIPMLNANDLNVWLPRLRRLGIMRQLIKPIRRAELISAVEASAAQSQAGLAAIATSPEPPLATVGPAAPLATPPLTPASAPAASEPSAEPPLRVLVADDSSDNRLLIDVFLKKAGYQLDEALDGLEAVEKFKQQRYDIVLMDIQMPLMDGYAATREIRAWEAATGALRTPIIALTASVLDDAIGKTFESGCDRHVSKPVRRIDLIGAIRELTGNSALPDAPRSEPAGRLADAGAPTPRRRDPQPNLQQSAVPGTRTPRASMASP